jgi:hypothetical protein
MLVRARINQLRRDSHRVAGFSDTAFENMADA